MYLLALSVAAALFLPAVATAEHRVVRCEVVARGEHIDGPCRYTAGRGGSFGITMADGRAMGGAIALSIDVAAPGTGEVRGLTAAGVHSRWGEARRQDDDGACWRGADFRVCVRDPSQDAPGAGVSLGSGLGQPFVSRCHMDVCSWIEQSPARETGQGSARVPGRRISLTARHAQSIHKGGDYPDSAPAGMKWSAPGNVQYFCSFVRPAFRDMDGSWVVLPLPQVFGASEGVTQTYLRACHPGSGPDPYSAAQALGYSAGQPARDRYPDFAALIAR